MTEKSYDQVVIKRVIAIPKETFFNLPLEKRERIIEAAIDEFSRNDYREAKINEIVRLSSIPKGSFYQYFEDKKDLFKYVIDLLYEKKMEAISRASPAQPSPPEPSPLHSVKKSKPSRLIWPRNRRWQSEILL